MSKRSLPRRPRKAGPDEAELDDLLDFWEPVAEPDHRLVRRPWKVRSAVQAFILSAVVYTAFHLFNYAPPYPLILALCLGGVLVRRAVGATAEPTWRRLGDAVRGPSGLRKIEGPGWYEGGDGMQAAIRRWDRRMEWGESSPERFTVTVLGRLGELADERLRLRHSITRDSDPVRAAELLGEDSWRLLHEQSGRVPRPREIAAFVDRLESL